MFRGDLLAMRVQENDFVFLCEQEINAYCKEQHLDFISFSLASMLHAVQYKERRVRLWNNKNEFLHRINTLPLGSTVHIRMQEISRIPVEAILRCRIAVKTPQCECENMLFGVELKVSVYACYITGIRSYDRVLGFLLRMVRTYVRNNVRMYVCPLVFNS